MGNSFPNKNKIEIIRNVASKIVNGKELLCKKYRFC